MNSKFALAILTASLFCNGMRNHAGRRPTIDNPRKRGDDAYRRGNQVADFGKNGRGEDI